ncbi:hypothetical protein RD110_10060 [Rhodoferax koreense]|uniref:Acyltransferase 3 domain-containing protein n=1 Tax=Rhodoferax koreensis TaxID=1842727 RepID=A0A1P8JUX9_9BURK|nr:hypothetical protein RD110_10060 [Rhodoferax koreense]
MLNHENSARLALLRFPLIVGVVFVHAYGGSMNLSNSEISPIKNSPIVGFVQDFISNGLARTAVPLFFVISGYLFFLKEGWSFEHYQNNVISRVKTLLIPFLFWGC